MHDGGVVIYDGCGNAGGQTAGVSAIVVTYWTGPTLAECLDALIRQPEIGQIIVVDNGNPPETKAWLRHVGQGEPRIRIEDPGRNLGFSVGCNLGAGHAGGDYIALVNPDLVVPDGAMAAFLDVFRRHEGVWLCGGRLEHPDGSEQRGGRRQILSPWRAFVELTRLDRIFPRISLFSRLHLHETAERADVHEVPTVSGAFMIIPRRLYQRLGGMDDNMFMHFEDADLCVRIRQLGGKVYYCGNVPLRHYLSTSDASRLFVEWHKTRSTSYYFHKHFFHDYPVWVLLVTSAALWVRFFMMAPLLLIRDGSGILRRWRRRGWLSGQYRETGVRPVVGVLASGGFAPRHPPPKAGGPLETI